MMDDREVAFLLTRAMYARALVDGGKIVQHSVRISYLLLEKRQNGMQFFAIHPERRDTVFIPIRSRRRNSKLALERCCRAFRHSHSHAIGCPQVRFLLPDGSFAIAQ